MNNIKTLPYSEESDNSECYIASTKILHQTYQQLKVLALM
jgi:hypothetical protein